MQHATATCRCLITGYMELVHQGVHDGSAVVLLTHVRLATTKRAGSFQRAILSIVAFVYQLVPCPHYRSFSDFPFLINNLVSIIALRSMRTLAPPILEERVGDEGFLLASPAWLASSHVRRAIQR